MTTLDRGESPTWQRALVPVGLLLSLSVHAVFAMTVEVPPPPRKVAERWVEMTIATPPAPPPPPPPAPAPAPAPVPPPKPKSVPKVVDAAEIPKASAPAAAAAEASAKPPRRVAGLSASSFATGSGTGFAADAGTTLGVAPSAAKMTIEEARDSVAYSAVSARPTCERPPFVVPEAVAAAGIEGQVRVVFDVTAEGKVQRVRVTGRLHPEADAACAAAWAQTRCTPGRQGDGAVTVTNMPYFCTIKAID